MAKLFIVCCHILVICYVNLALLSIMGKGEMNINVCSVCVGIKFTREAIHVAS